MEKKWFQSINLQSTNFIIAVILFFGGLWAGFPEGEARTAVVSLLGFIGSLGVFRQFFKYAKADWRLWLKSGNTLNYLFAALVAIFPSIPDNLFPALKGLLEAAMGGNWQGLVTSAISLITILYYWLKPKAVV